MRLTCCCIDTQTAITFVSNRQLFDQLFRKSLKVTIHTAEFCAHGSKTNFFLSKKVTLVYKNRKLIFLHGFYGSCKNNVKPTKEKLNEIANFQEIKAGLN